MYYRVLKDKRFGEGWKVGDIVPMDDNAARVPLEEGAIELAELATTPSIAPVEPNSREAADPDSSKPAFECVDCGKVCKSKAGLTRHSKSCEKKSQ